MGADPRFVPGYLLGFTFHEPPNSMFGVVLEPHISLPDG